MQLFKNHVRQYNEESHEKINAVYKMICLTQWTRAKSLHLQIKWPVSKTMIGWQSLLYYFQLSRGYTAPAVTPKNIKLGIFNEVCYMSLFYKKLVKSSTHTCLYMNIKKHMLKVQRENNVPQLKDILKRNKRI